MTQQSATAAAATEIVRHRSLPTFWHALVTVMAAIAVLMSIYQLFNLGALLPRYIGVDGGLVILDLAYLDMMVHFCCRRCS